MDEEQGTQSELDPDQVGEPETDADAKPEKPTRKFLKPLLIGLGVVVVLAGAGVGALFALHLGPFQPPPPPVVVAPPPMPPGKHGLSVGPGGKLAPGTIAKGPAGKVGGSGAPGAKPGAAGGPAKVAAKPKPAPKPAPVVAAAPAKPVAGQMASVIGMPPPHGVRGDPFAPYRNLALSAAPPPPLPALPNVTMAPATTDNSNSTTPGSPPNATGAPAPPPAPTPPTSPWHVAGIMTGDGIRAIMEKGTDSQVVQPGDQLLDGSATVASITDSQVILHSTGATPVDIPLNVTAGDTSAQTGQGAPTQ